MTDKLTPFEIELETALKQAEHLSRAMDKLLPRVGRTIHSSPFEPPTVVDDPEPDDIDGDDEGVR